ncbi:cysteine-rich receptor-like protein kinase 7 isoform X2 [Amaranthus tricolor]|nr:cysteine-rich receptor-like protein kinase 7 isoform X2 [Amaranthus tricolor]
MMMILSAIILLVLHLALSSTIDVHYESYNCLPESSSYAANSTFQRNLNYTLFTQLVANASLHAPSSTFEAGEGIDHVFAFYYCRPDLGAQVCHSCVANAATKVFAQCKLHKQGIVWFDECSLCYGENSSVFVTVSYEDVNYPKYNHTPVLGDYLEQYRNVYNSTITHLIDQAANNVSLSFATKTVNLSSSQSLRGIVQCGPIISGESCKECLNAAYVKMIQDWTNTMMFLPACYVGFELYGSRPPLLPPSSSSTLSVRSKVLIAVLCSVGILLVLGCGFWFWMHKHPSVRDSLIQDNVELIESERQLGLVQYSYYQLEEMTSGFNKKLGEGGFATVYYGVLSDGSTEVAVKVFTKKEAPKQFNTEINVLGGISHKNLVSLIGYCEEETILALVYEFMARGDLKSLLFEQSEALSWRKRLDIAIDVAQGLDYLHNGCCPAIVHRDVKPANILLNNKLRAKVADFGFSKIFPTEYVSNLQTRVVGTPGYLDPE